MIQFGVDSPDKSTVTVPSDSRRVARLAEGFGQVFGIVIENFVTLEDPSALMAVKVMIPVPNLFDAAVKLSVTFWSDWERTQFPVTRSDGFEQVTVTLTEEEAERVSTTEKGMTTCSPGVSTRSLIFESTGGRSSVGSSVRTMVL